MPLLRTGKRSKLYHPRRHVLRSNDIQQSSADFVLELEHSDRLGRCPLFVSFLREPENGTAYSVVQINGFASYNLTNPGNVLSLFWGSPDVYNSITFYGGLNDTNPLFTLTGADLVPYGATLGTGHDQVTITVIGATVASVKLSDGSQNAFEYTNPTATPLPAALPLYAAGVGVNGLLGRRRRKTKQAAAA